MLGLDIATSKSGLLWPTEYWKTLVDALGRGGAKHDPRKMYPDLAEALSAFVEERGRRYVPKGGGPMADHDDVMVSLIRVRRVPPGKEGLIVGHSRLPEVEPMLRLEFPYFGTIGNTKYEAQSKLNRQEILAKASTILALANQQRALYLWFRLTTLRRNRDLDNLSDALITVFNAECPQLDNITLVKLPSVAATHEALGLAAGDCCAAGAEVVS